MLAVGLTAVLLAAVGVLFSSTAPDGIEKLGLVSGMAGRVKALLGTPFSGYEASFLALPWMRKASAGLAGLALIYGVCLLLGRVAAARKRSV
jgi:hypothetical protein